MHAPVTRRSMNLIRAAALVTTILAGHGEAWARSVTAPNDTTLFGSSDIVVTARRTSENIQKVPISVTAFSGADLDRIVVNSPQDLNKLGPSITTNANGISRNGFTPSIRGLSASQASNIPSVITYFAEVPNFQVSFFDLENLQVLKGPQGTLFGETAVGGAVLFSPRKPTSDFSGYGSVQGGNYSYWQFEGAVSGALIKDRVMFRAAVQRRYRKGFTQGITSYGGGTVDLDNVDSTFWRISLVVKPTDTIENYTMYAGSKRQTNGASGALLYYDQRFMSPAIANVVPAANAVSAARFEFYAGYAPPAGLTWAQLTQQAVARQNALGPRAIELNTNASGPAYFDGVINQTRWDVSDTLTIRNIFSIALLDQIAGFENAPLDGNLPLLDFPFGPFIRGTRTARSVGRPGLSGGGARYFPKQITEEVQLQGKLFDNRLQWQAGGYYRKSSDRNWDLPQSAFTVVFGGPAGNTATLTRREEVAYAGYAQATYAVTPDIHLTGGYRRSYDRSKAETAPTTLETASFNGVDIPIPITGRSPLPNGVVQSTRVPLASHNSYSFTADWQVTSDVLLYAAHRMGYKPGGINNAVPAIDPNRTYLPESLKDIELGIKSRWELGSIKGSTNLALFNSWYSNVQQSNLVPGTTSTIISNDARARIRGLELEFSVIPNSWFKLNASLSYVDYKYTKWLENSVCSRQGWRPQCSGLAGTTSVIIDHAQGKITVGSAAPFSYSPDIAPDVSKVKWVIQPTIALKEATGEDISLGVNIYSRSSFSNFVSNTSVQAGMPIPTQNSVIGPINNVYIRPGYTIADLSAEWRKIRGSNISARVAVTNVFDKVYAVSANNAFTTTGADSAIIGEPRMAYFELRVDF